MRDYTAQELMVLEKGEIDCSDVEKLLGDYIETELPASLQCRVSEHIDCCSHCKQLEGEYKFVIAAASCLPTIKPSKEAKNRLRSALMERLGIKLGEL